MKLSVILPTLGRTQKALALIRNLQETAPGCEIVVIAEDTETTRAMSRQPVKLIVTTRMATCAAVQKWNLGAASATGDWFVTGSDDQVYLPGWVEAVERTPNTGFVGLYEGFDVGFVGNWAISRACACEVLGGVLMVPHYKSWWVDYEVCDLVKRAGRYAVTRDIVLVHNHHTLGRSADDATYALGRQWHAQDAEVYKRRKAQGYPIDWAPVIKGEYAITR